MKAAPPDTVVEVFIVREGSTCVWRSWSYLHCGCSSVICETRGGEYSTWPDPAVMVMWGQQGFSSLDDGDVWDGECSPSASQELSMLG